MCFNKNHPELKTGEVFVMNHNPGGNDMIHFDNLPYKTKRLGNNAYADDGELLPGLKPIFASGVEVEDHLNRAKCERAYLVGTHSFSFRRDVPAEIIAVVFFKCEDGTLKLCYHVRFQDGKEDYTAVCDSNNYKIITKDEALVILQNL